MSEKVLCKVSSFMDPDESFSVLCYLLFAPEKVVASLALFPHPSTSRFPQSHGWGEQAILRRDFQLLHIWLLPVGSVYMAPTRAFKLTQPYPWHLKPWLQIKTEKQYPWPSIVQPLFWTLTWLPLSLTLWLTFLLLFASPLPLLR